jgi:hypothetical protein
MSVTVSNGQTYVVPAGTDIGDTVNPGGLLESLYQRNDQQHTGQRLRRCSNGGQSIWHCRE